MSFLATVTAVLSGLALAGCVYLFFRDPRKLGRGEFVNLGFLTLTRLSVYKLIAVTVMGVLPIAALSTANLEVIEGAKTVQACAGCHVMWPMVNDMVDPGSDSLSARHYRSAAMSGDQCYACHSGYGFNGALEAKLEGYRHLVRYTTGLYPEPVKKRGHFNSGACFGCHEGTSGFEAVRSHDVGRERLRSGQMSCLSCHGLAHPSRSERTPGSASYQQLMEKPR